MSNLGDIGRLSLVLGGVLVLLGLAFLLIGRVPFLGRSWAVCLATSAFAEAMCRSSSHWLAVCWRV